MKPSSYLKIYPSRQPGYRLLFSTRKGSIALVPEEVAGALSSGIVPEDAAGVLAPLGMAVESAEEERAAVRGFLDEINRLDRALQISVILTLRCNFSCPYCYEGTLKSDLEMSPETADALVEFTKALWRPGKEELLFHFYGGEPLMARARIRRISEGLRDFAREKGITYAFTLVTNASLLTPAVVDELKPLGLRAVKVTLDGPPDLHDRTRPYRGGAGSFGRIVENLRNCPEGVKIVVGGNYAEDNFRRFPELLDLLLEAGLGPGRVAEVQFNPVLKTGGEFANPEYVGGCASINEPWLPEATLYLREHLLKRGFQVPRLVPSPCMIDVESAFTVHYDGTITQCPSLIGYDEFATGDIFTGMGEYRERFRVDHWKEDPRCGGCEYLPLCFGGCRYMAFVREGALGLDCQKPFLDATLGPLIELAAG